MGFNTWNSMHTNVNQSKINNTAILMQKLGLFEAGYNIITIDDGYANSSRNSNGKISEDPLKFQMGMRNLSDNLHKLGFKFGIYTSAGSMTCAKYPAILDHEIDDMNTYINDWDIDFIKVDNCWSNGISGYKRYSKIYNEIQKYDKDVIYSICSWGNNVNIFGPKISSMWRTTADLMNSFHSMLFNFALNFKMGSNEYGPDIGWNDADMLQVGNTGLFSMTYDEQETHMQLWAISKSPLFISTDLEVLSKPDMIDYLNLLKNKGLIRVNQDSLGIAALCIVHCDSEWIQYNSINLTNEMHPQQQFQV